MRHPNDGIFLNPADAVCCNIKKCMSLVWHMNPLIDIQRSTGEPEFVFLLLANRKLQC